MADNPQDRAQIIQMGAVTNSVPVSGQVWFDGTNLQISIGGTTYQLSHPQVGSQFSASNVTTTTAFNASTATLTVTNAVLGTLIQKMVAAGL